MRTDNVFLLDVTRTPAGVETWEIRDRRLSCTHHEIVQSFLLSFPDPHRWYELLEGLEEEVEVVPCSFRTLHGEEDGYIVYAGRETADLVERQTRHQARLYNVDIRPEQRFTAEHGIVPGGIAGADRFFSPPFEDLVSMQISCQASPHRDIFPRSIRIVSDNREMILEGSVRGIIDDLMDCIPAVDPDLILFPEYDTWSHILDSAAKEFGIPNTLSRNGRFRALKSRSYFSYGRMEHRLGAQIPEGRLIVDTRQSFMYREGDVSGILLASRLTGLSPNLTCRLTPGTLVSSYEVYEALARGIAVPYRKQDTEASRCLSDMRLDYRGGYMLHPDPGVYTEVTQIDFTSFYPSIIVKCNLSPETLSDQGKIGFLPVVLDPLLHLRYYTKQQKKTNPHYRGMDGILKWMLVTCFGYTGYKNARFGRIEVHEQITLNATRILKECIGLAESRGATVIHAIIDCLFIREGDAREIEADIRRKTKFNTESEQYDWVVILPQADGSGSYGSYYGRLVSGEIKMRGIAARRRDMPPYVRRMQEELLCMLAARRDGAEFFLVEDEAKELYRQYRDRLPVADLRDLVITRRIGREQYRNESVSQAVLRMYRDLGVELKPGMDASYLVMDEEKKLVCPSWDPVSIDQRYYRRLLDRAWKEVQYAFHPKKPGSVTCGYFLEPAGETV